MNECLLRSRRRAYLVATEILGLPYVRHVIGFPAADIDHETLVSVIGETLQRYIVGTLR